MNAVKGFTVVRNVGFLDDKLPGAERDYVTLAGDLWRNSAVAACLGWARRVLSETPVILMRDEDVIHDHPLLGLVRRPNPVHTGVELLNGLVLSYVVDGNAYVGMERSGAGRPLELWFIPPSMIEARTSANVLIADYLYKPSGRNVILSADDVIHIRDGIDPSDVRYGLSALKAALREIFADNECATYTASITRMPVPGLMIAPSSDGTFVDESLADKMKRMIRQLFTGERRGDPLVVDAPMTVHQFGFSPEQMALDKLQSIPESRICACIGIPGEVVGLHVGDDQKTYTNYAEAREAAYEQFVMPVGSAILAGIERALFPDFGLDSRYRLLFDYSQVRVLQDDVAALYRRTIDAFNAGLLTRGEARDALGYATLPAEDGFVFDLVPGLEMALRRRNLDQKSLPPARGRLTARQVEINRNRRARRAGAVLNGSLPPVVNDDDPEIVHSAEFEPDDEDWNGVAHGPTVPGPV